MNKSKLLFVSLLFISQLFYAQQTKQSIDELFKDNVEVYLTFKVDAAAEISALSKYMSIVPKTKGDKIYAYCNKEQYTQFLDFGYDFTILTPPSKLLKNPKMRTVATLKETNDWDSYPTYSAYIGMMNQFATDYPNLCQVFSIGQSEDGRELMVARISDNVGVEEGDAKVLYTSSMHGNELTGYVLSLRLIDYLLSNYGTNSQVTDLVNGLDIFINPLANPDGAYAGGNNTIYGATRSNANGVDLNRNYPDPQDGMHPDGQVYQAETLAFMQFADDYQFVLSSNWHTGAEVVNYPWDTWGQTHADDSWWNYVGREWADTVHSNSSGYFTDIDNGVTNGWQWYEVDGGRQDYMNAYHECREFTLELSDDFTPSGSSLPSYWNYQHESFIKYLEQALYGVRGTVTDAQTAAPIVAKVYIETHDDVYSFVHSDVSSGKYYRAVLQGTYTFTFSAPGYISKTIPNVSVTNLQATILDVQLLSQTSGLTDIADTTLLVYPNPTSNNFKIDTTIPLQSVQLIDLKGSVVSIFSADEVKYLTFDISNIEKGIYLVKAFSKKGIHTSKLLVK